MIRGGDFFYTLRPCCFPPKSDIILNTAFVSKNDFGGVETVAKHNKTEFILQRNLYRVLITLSVPIIINSLIQTLYNLVDGIWVSKLSSVHFAATAFVWPVNFLFISLGIGLSIAGTSLLSQLIGADNLRGR